MTAYNHNLILQSIDRVAEVETATGRQALAKVDALASLAKLAKAIGIDFAEGHVAAILIDMTKKRKAP